jgi:predicted  nucleic acid-binding Zn-ribbon protein
MPRVAGKGEPHRSTEGPTPQSPPEVERATLMARLVAVSETLRRSPSLEMAAAAVGRAVIMLTNAPRAAVFLRSPTGVVTCPWSHNLSAEYVGRLRTPDGANPWAHLSHHPELTCMDLPARRGIRAAAAALVEDVRQLPAGNDTRRQTEREGVRAVCSWPIGRGGRVFAAVAYYFDAPHTCSAPEREVVQAFTLQAAATLEQAIAAEARGQTVGEADAEAARIAEAESRLAMESARLAAFQHALEAESARRSAERAELTAERERLTAGRRELDADRDRLTETRRVLETESERFGATQAGLSAERESLGTLRRELDVEQTRLEGLRRELDLERYQLNGLRGELDDARERLAQERAELEAEQGRLADARAHVEAEQARFTEAGANLERERADVERERAGLERDRADVERERAGFERERADLERQRAGLGASAASDAAEAAQAAADVEQEKTRLIEARAELSAAEAKLTEMRAALDAEAASVGEARRRLEADRAGLMEVRETFEAERGRLEAVCRSLDAEKAELGDAQTTLASECTRLSVAVGTLVDLLETAAPAVVDAAPPVRPAPAHPAQAHPAAEPPTVAAATPQPRAIPTPPTRRETADVYRERLVRWAEAAARGLGCAEQEVLDVREAATVLGAGTGEAPDAASGAAIVLKHWEERWDGGGRPDGLKEDAIPLGARILAVAAAYAEMVTGRPGVPMLYYLDAKAALRKNAGAAYDPEVVQVFCRVADRG